MWKVSWFHRWQTKLCCPGRWQHTDQWRWDGDRSRAKKKGFRVPAQMGLTGFGFYELGQRIYTAQKHQNKPTADLLSDVLISIWYTHQKSNIDTKTRHVFKGAAGFPKHQFGGYPVVSFRGCTLLNPTHGHIICQK